MTEPVLTIEAVDGRVQMRRMFTGLLVGPTGVGITNAMITFAVNNAVAGMQSLIVSLDMPEHAIRHRIAAQLASMPNVQVDPARITVFDGSLGIRSVADIRAEVAKWKQDAAARFRDNGNGCANVYVDKLALICNTCNAPNQSAQLCSVMQELGILARAENVAVWTAMNTTVAAHGREVLTIPDTAGSIHIHDSVDLSLGLTRQPLRVNADLGDNITVSFMKTRYSHIAGSHTNAFMANNGRIWSSVRAYEASLQAAAPAP